MLIKQKSNFLTLFLQYRVDIYPSLFYDKFTKTAMPFNIGGPELFIIVLILVMLFGGKTIHEWAKGIGKASKDVRLVKKEIEEGFEGEIIEEKPHNEVKKIAKSKNKRASSSEGGVN